MPRAANNNFSLILSKELSLPEAGVSAVCGLLDEGGTVPFIARYRKEVTGGLDEVQILAIQERREYLVVLEQRRGTILSAIEAQGKLTAELRGQIMACATKTDLEDLYLPYKPRRRTHATIARERGLEPLAARILEQPADGDPAGEAAAFVDPEKEVPDAEAALAGAGHIAAEVIAETAAVRGMVRDVFSKEGELVAEMHPKKKGQRTKFEQYYSFRERAATIPSHRFLALRRGEREKALRVHLEADDDQLVRRIEQRVGVTPASPFADQLRAAARDAYGRLLSPSVENDIRVDLKIRADESAVEVFANNLRNLLLAAPLGLEAVLGIDPGLRTGCKCVALDETGKYLESATIFLTQGEARAAAARKKLLEVIRRRKPFAVAVGNGTGGRETEAFVRKLLVEEELKDVVLVQVNEAGASIYSASEIAREEFPDLDITIRGAISISRRLQDPLAELVKIDPKAIGVGQYQHDVNQTMLQRKLDQVVESSVNKVGVEINTASAPLLSRVAGIGPVVAKNIVAHREKNGVFGRRKDLLAVPKLGPKTFEQAAGFLRVRGSSHPLDMSAVHPERYKLVELMARDMDARLEELVGNEEQITRIDISKYVDGLVGEPTLNDILSELRKPGRDPRSTFEPPRFRDDVVSLEDLDAGMSLEGVVTNVTAFGAFVDIGVHQDGLVHISQLADHFVKDPHDVAQVGDRLKVRVLEVDLERRRISLSARSTDPPRQRQARSRPDRASGPPEGAVKRSDRKRKGGGDRGGDRGQKGGQKGGQSRSPRQDASQPKFSNNPFAGLLKRK